MKVFVSIPMSGREDKDILDEITTYATEIGDIIALGDEAFKQYWLGEDFDNDIEYVHNLFCDIGDHTNSKPGSEPVLYLAEALKKMTACDCILYARKYKLARGCCIESKVASRYCLYDKAIFVTKHEIEFRKYGQHSCSFTYNRNLKRFAYGRYETWNLVYNYIENNLK